MTTDKNKQVECCSENEIFNEDHDVKDLNVNVESEIKLRKREAFAQAFVEHLALLAKLAER